jgi:hypothetical protein
MLATIVSVVLIAMTPVTTGQGPELSPRFGGGGPDAYGYRYIDSDTAGGPTYTWIDIKGVGTEIAGMADDDIRGPFEIGFDFPYYWYTVSSFFLGSNGYIAFHDNTLAAPDFPAVPGIARPNNTLAVFMADMDPYASPSGSIWYWTNAANDTCIIQYDSMRFWNVTASNNTYQIIISRPDSSIRFQYKEQSGQPSNGWTPQSNQCGIENVSGRVGLNYLSGNTPIDNMYHPELAVLFYPPESTSMEVHDVGVRNAMNDRSGGTFVINGVPVTFWAVVQNYGNQTESDFKCYVNVLRNNISQFYDSITVSVPDPGDTDSIVFENQWTPTPNDVYAVEIFTVLPGDEVPTNDKAIVETRVVTSPATLTYDHGNHLTMRYYSWNGPGGYGNRFVPPAYPVEISSIRMASQATSATLCALGVFDDNGIGGGPGDTLFLTNVMVSTSQWYEVNVTPRCSIFDGAFFVGCMSAIPSAPAFGMDSTPPVSGQSWEYTGGWAPSREASIRDAAFNATVTFPGSGIEQELWPGPAQPHVTVNPNPFGTSARLRLINPRGAGQTAGVYDVTGTLVRTLELERGEAVFNGRDRGGRMLSEGIYFVRLVDADSQVSKLVIAR